MAGESADYDRLIAAKEEELHRAIAEHSRHADDGFQGESPVIEKIQSEIEELKRKREGAPG